MEYILRSFQLDECFQSVRYFLVMHDDGDIDSEYDITDHERIFEKLKSFQVLDNVWRFNEDKTFDLDEMNDMLNVLKKCAWEHDCFKLISSYDKSVVRAITYVKNSLKGKHDEKVEIW